MASSRTLTICLSVIVLIGSLSLLARAGDDPVYLTEDGLTPSDLHRIMGEAKATALDRSRRAQAAMAVLPEVDQTDYDVRWYDIFIRVNDTTEMLYGAVTFVAEAVVDGVSEIDVDFGSGMTVDSIKAHSGSLGYVRKLDVVTITLDRAYDTGEQFDFVFYYNGHPVEGGLQAFAFDLYDGAPSISSLSEPYFARTWWPCKDRMDDKADSIGIHIEVASDLYCASNGTLDSIITQPGGNSRTFHYTCHYPIATYLFSVAIAPFVVWEQEYFYNGGQNSMPIVHHVYANRYTQSLGTWGQTPDMIAALVESYGTYPFLTDKYGHANFNWGGAMEHQTVTSMNGTSSFGFTTSVIVHELGHQWWGDLVTCKSWHDIWLNEGWASYSEAVWELANNGWAAYHAYMNTMAYKGGGTVWCDDTTNVWRIFNGGLSYDKGAWVVHMLRGVLGEALFAAGIQAYRSTFAYDAATTEDFKTVWEGATEVDLDPFISQWVYGQYYPKYYYYYMDEPSDSGGYDIYLVVRQVQTTQPAAFRMPVDFFFDYASLPDDTVTLTVDERSELFKFNLPTQIAQIKLDPSDWILKEATDRPWEMFIVTLDPELSDGVVGQFYLDTIETRGGTGDNLVSIISGKLPTGLSVAATGVVSGTPTVEGLFTFQIGFANPATGYADQRRFDIAIAGTPCCSGKVGDVNGEGGDEPTISDVSMLIDMLFISGWQPVCLTEADVNQSGGSDPTPADITIGDIGTLIDHLFISQAELLDCL